MNKTLIVAGIVIFLIVSWLTGFVTELNKDVDVSYGFHEKELILGKKGDGIQDLSTLSLEERKKVWNNSPLKEEMLSLFPNFSEMQDLVESEVEESGEFKEKLLSHISKIKEDYIGGALREESAKASLSNF